MRKLIFQNNQIYHIYNRGVDKRIVFNDLKDYAAFLDYLADCNKYKLIDDKTDDLHKDDDDLKKKKPRKNKVEIIKEDDPLVDILVFCLMPNHFHLLLRQRIEGGITKFMQRVGTGYTMFFNSKEKRSGSLFQGRFKAIHVKKQQYLDYLIFYIHFNPLKLLSGIIMDNRESLIFLNDYEWSSHREYCFVNEMKESMFLSNREFILSNFKNSKEYKKKALEWMEILKIENKDKDFNRIVIDFEE
ncbi:MAG: transposase [Candidatus Pacebacteria bacterium]|nr:transposase [Candidatus Paceibacterota bacterium]